MKLANCPECGGLLDIDHIKVLEPNDIVGCGQKEGEFTSCNECGGKYGSKKCEELLEFGNFTPTKAKDYKV